VADKKRRGAGGSPARRPRAVQTAGWRVTFWLGWWAISYALWVLLVFNTHLSEFVLGVFAAALAATGAELVRSRGYAPFAPDPRWARALLPLPRQVLVDTWRLTVLLARHFLRGEPIQGSFRIIHFPCGPRDDPRAQARLAVAQWIGGVSPNTYVIGIDDRRQVAVVHQLIRDEHPPELDPAA
jgi:multisubunit Na+/H+ antiporter MnhE subunit